MSVPIRPQIAFVPVMLEGQSVRFKMYIYYRDVSPGPLPTLVFNHGSTGNGQDPSLFIQPIDNPDLAHFFVERGWAVVLLARRGRTVRRDCTTRGSARSRGLGYTGEPSRAIAGADRALDDIEAAMEAILHMPFVNHERVVIGGQSRGGILSVAYAGRHPEQVTGVLNFVGGWLGHPYHPTAVTVNQTLFNRGSAYPGSMLWLYGHHDPFYPLAHSRENFGSFKRAGGQGTFREFVLARDESGHRLCAHPDVWGPTVAQYLEHSRL